MSAEEQIRRIIDMKKKFVREDAKILKAERKCRTCWYGHVSFLKQEIYCLNVQVPTTATFRPMDSVPYSETCYVSDTEGRAL